MAIREYQFITGIETSTSPDPATPSADADIMTKGFADDTYAQFTSWGTKKTSNANIKAIAVADRSDGQVVFNTASNSFYRFDSDSSASDDGDTVLAPDTGTGRWLKISSGSSSGDTLVEQLDSYNAGITAGEALSANDALCLQIHNGTGSNVYRYFKADADNGARMNFCGFAKSAVTVTPQITTYTLSAALVSGNVVPMTINSRPYSTTYASSSDATLQALATAISADPDVLSATVSVQGGNQTGTDDRTITITSRGGLSLNITGTTITGGASQATVTLSNTQTASGGAVDLHYIGPQSGFSSLEVGDLYWLSTTAGSITNAVPNPAQPIYVGQAISSTHLFVNPNLFKTVFGTAALFMRSHGSSTGYDMSTNTATTENFNFVTWSTQTSDSNSLGTMSLGDAGLGGNLIAVDGYVSGVGTGSRTRIFNRSSWAAAGGNRTTAKSASSCAKLNGSLYFGKGVTDNSIATAVLTIDAFNGTTWTSAITSFASTRISSGAFVVNNVWSVFGADSSGGSTTTHETYNGTTVSTATAVPFATNSWGGSSSAPSSKGSTGCAYGATNSYTWDGSSWSSNIAVPTGNNTGGGVNATPVGGFNPSGNAYMNGGCSSGNTTTNASYTHSGSAWATSVSSTSSRAGACGGVG